MDPKIGGFLLVSTTLLQIQPHKFNKSYVSPRDEATTAIPAMYACPEGSLLRLPLLNRFSGCQSINWRFFKIPVFPILLASSLEIPIARNRDFLWGHVMGEIKGSLFPSNICVLNCAWTDHGLAEVDILRHPSVAGNILELASGLGICLMELCGGVMFFFFETTRYMFAEIRDFAKCWLSFWFPCEESMQVGLLGSISSNKVPFGRMRRQGFLL